MDQTDFKPRGDFQTRVAGVGEANNPKNPSSEAVTETAGLFQTSENLQKAIRALEGSSFPRQDISIMGNRGAIEKVFGEGTVDPQVAMDNPETPRQAPSRPEEQTIGTAALIGVPAYIGAMALAIGAGAVTFPALVGAAILGGVGGGAVGGVLSKLLGGRYDNHLDEQIERGGLLLWVRTPTPELQEEAKRLMAEHGGEQIHTHEIAY
jgi:hypothetical protein